MQSEEAESPETSVAFCVGDSATECDPAGHRPHPHGRGKTSAEHTHGDPGCTGTL